MQIVDRSPFLAGLNYAKGQLLTTLRIRGHYSGATAISKSVDDALHYVQSVVNDYLQYGALGNQEYLVGKDILEIGPGDNLGVALLLLAKGARSVTCVDGFRPVFDQIHNSRVYEAIYGSLSAVESSRVGDLLKRDRSGHLNVGGDRLTTRYGVRIDRKIRNNQLNPDFDLILSRAVLEHVEDLSTGWRNMVGLLRPKGEMWHKIDFRCHHMFEAIHPLYFLTVANPIWRLISRPDPTLNRLRLPTYRALAEEWFRDYRVLVTHVVGDHQEILPHVNRLIEGVHYTLDHVMLVESIRPKLPKAYRDFSTVDLLTNGIFLVARSPL